MSAPALYFDLGSPYAYLAVFRAESLLGVKPELRPVVLGAIFQWRGWGSWARTERREAGMADVEARARRYGLPPVVWPPDWPLNSLRAQRAALWAADRGGIEPFVRRFYEREFAGGEDVSGVEALVEVADEAGLPGSELPAAIEAPEHKERLKAATLEAYESGVVGVPTLLAAGKVFYGDDRLERAAEALAAADR
jgi:2-hydroxychromene-2-carboxylate isomerase